MPRRKEIRKALEEALDVLQTIMMYASEPLRPSNIRVFDISEKNWLWLKGYEEKWTEMLYGWKRMMNRKMPPALPQGTDHEPAQVSPDPADADADVVR